jgi:GTP pyrophosphokinase
MGLAAMQTERLIDVEWDHDQPSMFVVSIEIEALDRSRLLQDIASVMADHQVNILACSSQVNNERVAKLRFDFELADPGHLGSIVSSVKRVDSVYEVYRVLPGKAH